LLSTNKEKTETVKREVEERLQEAMRASKRLPRAAMKAAFEVDHPPTEGNLISMSCFNKSKLAWLVFLEPLKGVSGTVIQRVVDR